MSKRRDIIELSKLPVAKFGLVYSEVLGWIDLGHAGGEDIRKTLAQMEAGEKGASDFYEVIYSQSMYKFRHAVGIGRHIRWSVRKGLSQQVKHSIVLAMMMRTGTQFESLQASLPFSWTTDSGYSAEDLVSDLLGFYRVVRPMNYFAQLRIVSKEEALKRWDHYGPIGNYKNKMFRPLLFPAPTAGNNAKPYFGSLPAFMTAITPYNSFSDGAVKVITNNGAHMNIGNAPMREYK